MGLISIRCPNTIKRSFIDTNGNERHTNCCNSLLMVFREPAIFEDYFFCPVCKAHWRITLNERGAARATLIPNEVKLKTKPLPMHVIGEKERKNAPK